MTGQIPSRDSVDDSLRVAPSLEPALREFHAPMSGPGFDRRTLYISSLSVPLGIITAIVAQLLLRFIGLITSVCFHGTLSMHATPLDSPLGPWVILVPLCGVVLIGLLVRYGHAQVRGHGIPEAMEQVLTNESRIAPRLTLLKPLGAAISIGTGGPYGAEGPIIATGGAIGSLLGQLLHTSVAERKTLLAAGAAAGIAGIFGTPIAGVLLAIELLLFEYSSRSIVPVALACAAASVIHGSIEGFEPMFGFEGATVPTATLVSLGLYTVLGTILGVAAVVLTRSVHVIESLFKRSGMHWMVALLIGGAVVGVIGWISPRTLGSGYYNLHDLLAGDGHAGRLAMSAAVGLCVLKFASWTISLGSGTSGGTLAPVFTIGGAFGLVIALAINPMLATPIDVRMAALVGMVGIFAGSSRALLTSVVFAFELTLEPAALLPALCGCTAAFVVSCLLMRRSIMTESLSRRGVKVPVDYLPDPLEMVSVSSAATPDVIVVEFDQTILAVREWLLAGHTGASHQGFPVVDSAGLLRGVITRGDIQNECDPSLTVGHMIRRPPVIVYDDCSLRQAADHMVRHNVGRLPVVRRDEPGRVVGIITRSDILRMHYRRLEETSPQKPRIRLAIGRRG